MIKNDFVDAFSEVDLIMSPSSPSSAFKIGSKTGVPIDSNIKSERSGMINIF